VVRGVNEPAEIEAVALEQKLDAEEAGETKKDLEPLLDQNDYEEAHQLGHSNMVTNTISTSWHTWQRLQQSVMLRS
jgi:hypothetical protein